MIAIVHVWWVAMIRGAAALSVALIVLLQSHASMTMVTAAFGAFILVDSIIALAGVFVVRLGVCGTLLLAESLAGITVAAASLADLYVAPHSIHVAEVPMIAWGFVLGVTEVYIGIRVGRELPAGRLDTHRPMRNALSPERTCLLAGMITIAFAISLLALPMTSAGIAVPVTGFFAAALGYLRLRVGLSLGTLRLELEHIYLPS
jgi:uncharacterized membrane protein HdeD (DUF308 family)